MIPENKRQPNEGRVSDLFTVSKDSDRIFASKFNRFLHLNHFISTAAYQQYLFD